MNFNLESFINFLKFFMIRFPQFWRKTELPFTKLWNFQSWYLQLKSLLQTNIARLYSALHTYPHHHPCTPC